MEVRQLVGIYLIFFFDGIQSLEGDGIGEMRRKKKIQKSTGYTLLCLFFFISIFLLRER